MSIALEPQFAFIEMSCESSWYMGPFWAPVGLGFLALLKLGQCPQTPKQDTNWMEEKHTAISSSLTLISCRASPSPLQTRHHPLMVSWWTSPGAPASHSRTEDRDVLPWLVWKQRSAQVNPCGMLGTPAWDEAVGRAVSTASTSVSQMLLSQLVSPAHSERDLCYVPTHSGLGHALLWTHCWRT